MDEASKAIILISLRDKVPAARAEQDYWFKPRLAGAAPRARARHRRMAGNVRRGPPFGAPVSVIGLLRSRLDSALNDGTALGGVRAAFAAENAAPPRPSVAATRMVTYIAGVGRRCRAFRKGIQPDMERTEATRAAAAERPWRRTHPWIDFAFDLRRLKHTDWLALGECAGLCAYIGGAPLDPRTADEIYKLYLAKGALATTAIEGNTLTESEARERVAGTLRLPPSQEYLAREIDNIVDACAELADGLARQGAIPIAVETVGRLNALALRGLDVGEHVVAGETRRADVVVGPYRCPDWRHVDRLLALYCKDLARFPAPADNRIAFAILKALFAHVHLAWIHPFGDGNGRTARLVEHAILLEAGLPRPACHLLSDHYNRTRTEYYRQLERASAAEGGLYGFAAYAIAGLADGLRKQAGVIREHHRRSAWRDFVHGMFANPRNWSERRRRMLALELAKTGNAIPVAELPDLTVDLARAYATVGYRTLLRDVEALAERGVALRGPGGVRANLERIAAFPAAPARPYNATPPV